MRIRNRGRIFEKLMLMLAGVVVLSSCRQPAARHRSRLPLLRRPTHQALAK